MSAVYPWSAVVGQDALKHALLLCAIDPAIGGVLVQGPRGVAKTTLARALGELVRGNFVELPLGATEERVVGTLDLESALRDGSVKFAPGLLARAHHGVLYVDEINLLPDLIVDLLLDAAATGQNRVERDGVSHTHPARFVLVGTMNPEEGELRPQLIDRFGLSVSASNHIAPAERAAIVTQRLAFDADPVGFAQRHTDQQAALIARCRAARAHAQTIPLTGPGLERATQLCYAAGVEGVRADLAMLRAARAHAAWHERNEITAADVDAVAELALAHRRHGPPDPSSGPGAPASSEGNPSATGRNASDLSAGPSSGSAHADQETRSEGARRGELTPGSAATPPASPRTSRWPAERVSSSQDSEVLWPVPIAIEVVPALPACLSPGRKGEAENRRRGKARVGGRVGAGAGRDAAGAIDWFASLLGSRKRRPRRDQLRRRARRSPLKQVWVLALDCSASMLRGGALAAAKGVAMSFASSARRAGAHVALITFRGGFARRAVETGASQARLRRTLAAQSGGGGTPFASALSDAQALFERPAFRSAKVRKHLVIFTDGRIREALETLPAPRAETLLVDCERSRIRLRRAPLLAARLRARYLALDPTPELD